VHAGRVRSAALFAAIGVLGLAGYVSQTGSSGPAQPAAHFGNADKGRTVTIHRGELVRVTLDTTNWRFDPPAGTGVIRWRPEAVASGSEGCAALEQCGSVSISGFAVQAGRATVHASRERCGELRLCEPSVGSYTLTIVVVA
jgi:hypothetical protein